MVPRLAWQLAFLILGIVATTTACQTSPGVTEQRGRQTKALLEALKLSRHEVAAHFAQEIVPLWKKPTIDVMIVLPENLEIELRECADQTIRYNLINLSEMGGPVYRRTELLDSADIFIGFQPHRVSASNFVQKFGQTVSKSDISPPAENFYSENGIRKEDRSLVYVYRYFAMFRDYAFRRKALCDPGMFLGLIIEAGGGRSRWPSRSESIQRSFEQQPGKTTELMYRISYGVGENYNLTSQELEARALKYLSD